MHHFVRDGFFPDMQRDQEGQQAPGRADEGADYPSSRNRVHAAVVLLHTLQGRDRRVERHPVPAAQLIDREAKQYRRQRAEDPLSRQRDRLSGFESMIHR